MAVAALLYEQMSPLDGSEWPEQVREESTVGSQELQGVILWETGIQEHPGIQNVILPLFRARG